MELIVAGLVVLVLYLIVRYSAKGIAGLAGVRHRAYRQIAQKYRGRYESRGLVDPPTVSFGHGGSTVRVGLAPVLPNQPQQPRTRVVARFAQGLAFRMELMPASRSAPAQTPRGTRPVRIGHAAFDSGYNVQANDPDIARELFGLEHVRAAVESLRQMAPPSGMLISINPERLLVQVDKNLGLQAPALDQVVSKTLAIHDWLLESVSARLKEGIDIVTVGLTEAGAAGPPTCEVCGDPIAGLHVVCSVCRTPFHRDCWTFIGGCSTYGCPSKQCVTPTT